MRGKIIRLQYKVEVICMAKGFERTIRKATGQEKYNNRQALIDAATARTQAEEAAKRSRKKKK